MDDCYIKNFSLTAYRKYQELEKKSIVKIKNITAVNAFFDSDFDILMLVSNSKPMSKMIAL